MMRLIAMIALLSMTVGCASYEQAAQLDGVAVVESLPPSVRLVPNDAMQLSTPVTDAGHVTLAPGDEVSLGDGYHVTIHLRFLGAEGNRLRFRQETVHRPPSGPMERDVRHLTVPAYSR